MGLIAATDPNAELRDQFRATVATIFGSTMAAVRAEAEADRRAAADPITWKQAANSVLLEIFEGKATY